MRLWTQAYAQSVQKQLRVEEKLESLPFFAEECGYSKEVPQLDGVKSALHAENIIGTELLTSRRAISWPGAPHENQFIDAICAMLEELCFEVEGGDPTLKNTPFLDADLYILHWPDAIFVRPISKLKLWFYIARTIVHLFVLKLRGTRVIWFTHNLKPHSLRADQERAWRVLTWFLTRQIDGWVTLAPSTAELVRQQYPALKSKPHQHVWHPPYGSHYSGTKCEAREALGLHETALLFGHVGLLRSYKNLLPFARTFAEIAPEAANLAFYGKAEPAIDAELKTLASDRHDVTYHEGKLSSEDFDRALTAVDVFVAPYKNYLHSGTLIHALSRGCVVVTPNVPFGRDLQQAVGTDWVFLFDQETDLTSDFLKRVESAVHANAGQRPDLAALEPKQNIEGLAHLLTTIGLTKTDLEMATIS